MDHFFQFLTRFEPLFGQFWTIFWLFFDHFLTIFGHLLKIMIQNLLGYPVIPPYWHFWGHFGPFFSSFLNHFLTSFQPLFHHFWTTFRPVLATFDTFLLTLFEEYYPEIVGSPCSSTLLAWMVQEKRRKCHPCAMTFLK